MEDHIYEYQPLDQPLKPQCDRSTEKVYKQLENEINITNTVDTRIAVKAIRR
jgi:hypothetical protein